MDEQFDYPLTVGFPKTSNEKKLLSYLEVVSDPRNLIGEWINPARVLPHPFELVVAQIIGKCKLRRIWWDGSEWQGLRLLPDEKILGWKKDDHEYLPV